jgi:hypothetical protein
MYVGNLGYGWYRAIYSYEGSVYEEWTGIYIGVLHNFSSHL